MPRPSQCPVCMCFEQCLFPGTPGCAEDEENRPRTYPEPAFAPVQKAEPTNAEGEPFLTIPANEPEKTMKVISTIELPVNVYGLTGQDIIDFANELVMRKAQKDAVDCKVVRQDADPPHTWSVKYDVRLSHTSGQAKK